jgi:glycosyltransferase involved in cell wall biosynthesis
LKHCNDIVFVLPRFSGGGAEKVAINLLTGLHNRGYEISIVVFDKSGELLPMISDNIPIYNLFTFTLKRSIVPLIKKIRQLNPKIVFSTFGYVNVALLATYWFLPRQTEVWIREANLPSISLPNNSKPKLMHYLYRFLSPKADKLICTSMRMKNEFISNFSVSESMIEVLSNPVDVELIRKSSLPVRYFDNGGVRYVASGRLIFQKGFDRLLHWFSELDNKKSTLVILGDGNSRIDLIQLSNQLNLQDRVKFVGFCDNPWQWYAGADVFLLPSRWEGMPNVALESLACGTPVIATKESGGIKEIVENDDIIVVNSEKQFVDAMNKVDMKDKSFIFNSLLPNRFRKENVVSIVEGWLNEIK